MDENTAGGADIIKLFVVSIVSRDERHVPLPMSVPIVQAATAEASPERKTKISLIGVSLSFWGQLDEICPHAVSDLRAL